MKLFTMIIVFSITSTVWAQESDESLSSPGYVPPTKAEWRDAGLDINEYGTAVRYEVSIEEWKEMDSSRDTHITSGWALIAAGLITPAVEATVIWGGGIPYDAHPNQEVFIMASAAAFACILTGIVILVSTPGPEDFKNHWMKKNSSESFTLLPTTNGFGLAFDF
jgi:hypothetical protein